MTDRIDEDEFAADATLGDPDRGSTWNTLTGAVEVADLVAADELDDFLVDRNIDPEGILADTTDQVAPDSPPLDPDRPDSARVDTSILPHPDGYPE